MIILDEEILTLIHQYATKLVICTSGMNPAPTLEQIQQPLTRLGNLSKVLTRRENQKDKNETKNTL